MFEKITNRVYLAPSSNNNICPTLGLVAGDNYSLIVDAGISPKHIQEFLSNVNTLNIAPIKYLVFTHYHYDHTFGISEYKNTISIANSKTKALYNKYLLLSFDDQSLEKYKKEGLFSGHSIQNIKNEIPNRENFKLKNIDIEYHNELIIDLGGVNCIIKEIPSSHTDDSTIIYIPNEKVMFLGDALYTYSVKGKVCYDIEKNLKMIDTIKQFDAEYFLSSHEALHNKRETLDFFNQLESIGKLFAINITKEEVINKFVEINKRLPNNDESFIINSYMNGIMNK